MAIPMILVLAMPITFTVFCLDEYGWDVFGSDTFGFYFSIPLFFMLPFYLGLLANILLIPAMIIASPFGLTYLIWMFRKESRENVDRAKNRLKNLA